MRGNTVKKRGICVLLVIVIIATTMIQPAPSVRAASKNIIISDFIKQLVQAIKLEVNDTAIEAYVNAAITAGIVKNDDFIDYSAYLTRTDAAVLLNRADEYLHGDTVDAELLKVITKKRISDIKTIAEGKRELVAKIYAKGIIKGYSNGYYIQNREFKGNSYLTIATAKSFINLVVNPKGRAKVSPDGQLIRTTNLPKNAKNYEYILESFPNKFYEKKCWFELSTQFKAGTLDEEHYAFPVDMRTEMFETWYDKWNFSIEMDKYLYKWADKAEIYLNYLFNVNYRTINNEWIKGLSSVYVNSNLDMPEVIKERYVDRMKKNKVIVESSMISVEPSTLYDNAGDYCMRAYVRYRITANNINEDQSELIYSPHMSLLNLKNGEWRTGYFDIRFNTNDPFNGDGSDWAIGYTTVFFDEE